MHFLHAFGHEYPEKIKIKDCSLQMYNFTIAMTKFNDTESHFISFMHFPCFRRETEKC